MTEILVTSSVLIVVIALLRLVLRGKISQRVQYALWLLVAVRLLVPVSFVSSPVSVMNAVEPVTETIQIGRTEQQIPAGTGQIQNVTGGNSAPQTGAVAAPSQPQSGDTAQIQPAEPGVDPGTVLRWVWLAGAAAVGCWFLLSNLVFRRRLVRAARPLAGADCPLPVYVSAGAPSPCLSGLVRPGIYLTPDCPTEGSGLKHILAHELTHRRQGDQFWALIRCLCLAIYWFNPLVWLAAALSRRDCELSCDEGAIKLLGEGERTAYGRTLLSLVTTGSNPAELLRTATTMSSGARGLRERIALIAKKPRRAAGVLAAALVVVAVAVGCTFTGAQPQETLEPSPTGDIQSPSPSPTEGTEPDNSAVLVDDFSYTGIHRDVTYYPDAPADGSEFDESTARTYTIVLCQPVTQGQGGIWCVERWYDDKGERHFVLPDTDLPAEEFYAQCQAQADETGSTGSSWADLDINWVLLNFVTDTFHVSNFSSREGSDYLADRGGTRETGTRPAASTDLEQALEGLLPEGSTAVLTLERHSGGEVTRKTVTADPDRLGMGLDWRDWSYADAPAEEPECDAAIYLSGISEPAGAVSHPAIGDDGDYLKFYQGSGLVRRHTDGTDIWYYVQSGGEEYDVGAEARFWYDDAEYMAALAIAVTPQMLEEARDKYDIPPVDDDPAHQDFALVAWVWSEQLAENLRNLEPDSQYAVLDAQVYSANLPASGDYYAPDPGVEDSFVFIQELALQVPNLYTAPYQAGSGLWEIEDGPYTGWYGWGLFRGMEKQGDNWVSNGGFTG
ncbi:M56 family metallopeptidase [uncultured Pseudoflavonifractor sp.]|uniref:M56 family metallopeptidase n=1 Tax=uncultured Pseudoflavonifractor sp. TaxID=1221379 RepID=UPI0025E11C97|nr:M56 family metallopeptidase [uncultured Pseudoflavonifractor sp.]